MTRNAQDIIDDMRNIVKPRIAEMLLEANFEGCGKEDKAEFETEFEMTLTLAEKALEQTKWIPVSERLPENPGRYLAYIVNKHDSKLQYIMTCDYFVNGFSNWFPDDDCASDNVIAWMPLPKPYKESE